MIEINNNKEKNLVFEIQLSGITPKELNGFFRMNIDGIEYGFPAQITETSIGVDIPALKSVIHRPLRNGEKFKAKLELIGNDNYIKPWDDNVVIKSSVMVEAKLIEKDSSSKKPMVKILTDKKEIPIKKAVPKPVKKEVKVTKEHLIQYMVNHGTKSQKIQDVLIERCIKNAGTDDNKKVFVELYKYYKKGKEQ